MTTWPDLESVVRSHKTLICVGSGGVGKTTISATIGVFAARLGLRVLVMTIDPSLRLKQALGVAHFDLRADDIVTVTVPGRTFSGRLDVTVMNPERQFRKFISNASSEEEVAQRLLRNRLYKQLSTTLSGSQEFTSLLQLLENVESRAYDLVILDTPPAQHAIEFLDAPLKLTALFQEKVVSWFVGDIHEVSFLRRVISRSTHALFLALEKVTGSQFMRELSDFFISVRSVQAKITERAQQIVEVLRSEQTKFLLVTGFDAVKLAEAEDLESYLKQSRYNMGGVIVNRAFPEWEGAVVELRSPLLAQEYHKWRTYHEMRERLYDKFINTYGEKLHVVRIPDLIEDTSGLDGLERLADELKKAFH